MRRISANRCVNFRHNLTEFVVSVVASGHRKPWANYDKLLRRGTRWRVSIAKCFKVSS